ncbi:peptidoglycan-binding protein [Streptomyces sp. NPDC045470]|uniref:LysM peptidoglycan-binding domain-containing protein n=1 Tax=Streptomyces sp. NPDC045470 TaxID=3155469 RepID=UPI0033F1E5F9
MGACADVIRVALAEVGYQAQRAPGERPSGHQKYSGQVPGLAWSNYQPWCATWTSWVALKSGTADLYPRTASVETAMNWFKNKGRWSAYPAVGAQVIYGVNGDAHTGLCLSYDRDHIYTVEGNTSLTNDANGNKVMRRTRLRRDAYVHGYGLPRFPEGIVTADPELKGRAGFVYKATASGPVTGGGSGGSHAKPGRTRTVLVRAGQTLGTIAASAGVSLAALLGLNPQVRDANVIYPGDRITVPDQPEPHVPTPNQPPSTRPSGGFPGRSYFGPGKSNSYVTALGQALVRHGYGRFYSVGPGPRWTTSDWRAVRAFQHDQGWTGSNADGYPGPSTWARLMNGAPATSLSFPGRSNFGPGRVNQHVTALGQALVRHGYGRFYSVGPGPRWTDSDRNAVRAFQRAQGWGHASADGYPGPETWRRLMQ